MKLTQKSIRRRQLLVLSIFVILAGCKINKDLPRPEPELPISFQDSINADTLGIAALPWQSFFQDQKLQALIDSTLRNNFDMALALKNIEQAQAMVKQSKWNQLPMLELQLNANTLNPSTYSLNGKTSSMFLGSNHMEDFAATALLSWEADIWGKIRLSNKTVLAEYLQTEASKKVLQTQLIASVAKGYFNLLMLDEQLRVAKHHIRLSDSSLHSVKALYAAGQVTDVAVQQVEAQHLLAAAILPYLQREISVQENALHLLSGQLPGTKQARCRLQDIEFPAQFSTGLPAAIMRRRPDIRYAELDLTRANAKVGIQKAQFYPSLRITATGGVNALKASDWFNVPNALFGMVAGSVVQPLLQHKQLQTQYKIAQLEREKSVIRFRQTVLQAVGEITDALTKIDNLHEQQRVSALRVSSLQQATSKVDALFLNGMANYMEVITAQRNALDSELDLASLRCQQLLAMTDLYRSLGGGIF
ncbi:efflux transporter outer membrane subunit [Sphingobacterium sp. Mn56C]|uniref:efflux transporter outer membrane subunit n=1 Tax=Sphingobacterium sp. Mn56C TaxID=3395261 RepID=UPI003BCFCEA5